MGDQELLAVLKSQEHWRHCLEGRMALTLVADYNPNTFLDSKPTAQLSRRHVRWQKLSSLTLDQAGEDHKGVCNIGIPFDARKKGDGE